MTVSHIVSESGVSTGAFVLGSEAQVPRCGHAGGERVHIFWACDHPYRGLEYMEGDS